METLFAQFADWGGPGLLIALFLGTFVSEDLACLSAGSLAAAGRIDLAAAIGACFAGIVVGDLLLYAAGRAFGGLLRSGPITRFVSNERLDRGTEWLLARGASAIFVGRFISGLRLPTYLAAGALRMRPATFLIYLSAAALIWTPLLIGAAAIWQTALPGNAIISVFVAFPAFIFMFRMAEPVKRRLAWGRLHRILLWEFWPLWIFYTPVVIYILALAVRFRGLTFTAANPSMPAGGFVGESKNEIYKLMGLSERYHEFALPYAYIAAELDPEARFDAASRFIEGSGLAFPVVVKPDAGERGNGVTLARDRTQLRRALTEARGPSIVQEYFGGVEASLFYCRMPGEQRGCIFSITEKSFPAVIGDGSSNIQELILRDSRAFILAEKYFERNAERLRVVPASGEIVRLVDIGSHSKGAIFRDGDRLWTPELEAALDAICREIPGFYFGRFDVRASSFAEMKNGRGFRIIELNGVTSESTNIYDPRYSLVNAYKILFRQWYLAFRIGAANAEHGARVTSIGELATLIIAVKRVALQNDRPYRKVT